MKKLTYAQRNVYETKKLLAAQQRKNLFIDGLSAEEQGQIRSRIFHSGTGIEPEHRYIATDLEMLPSAIHLLTTLRNRTKVRLENRGGNWWLTAKPSRRVVKVKGERR